MFSRQLTEKEKTALLRLEEFVRNAHANSDSHDYAHVLTVCKNAIHIAKFIPDPVDPFILTCGTLLHDIGKSVNNYAHIHGLFGGAIAEEFLDGQHFDQETVLAVTRVVVRHTRTSFIPPETIEEKIAADSDLLDRFGVMGIIRGLVGKVNRSMGEIVKYYNNKNENDLNRFHFEYSKEIAMQKLEETKPFIEKIKNRLDERLDSIEEMFVKEKLI
ncbi:MAG: HD domain-containing protein [Promethearchaeota archaeon]